MRRRILGVLTVALVIASMFAAHEPTYAKTENKRQIVVFNDNVDDNMKVKILDKHKALKVKDVKGTNAVVVRVSMDNKLLEESEVRYVEEDYIVRISGSSSKKDKNDNQVTAQPAEVVPWGVEYMNNLVSDNTDNGDGIKTGIIDTGIDVDHPDLAANIKGGYNTTSKKKSYDDDNGHGTHVAGIIGAVDNEVGVIGVAPQVDLYAIKALDYNGDGYLSDLIEAIEWCIVNNMDIINMSLGIDEDSLVLRESVMKAYNSGILMVAAAGNNHGGRCQYPALYKEVIGVGAIDQNNSIAEFSAIEGVDVWAPGVSIYSTHLDGYYLLKNGTSMAAPHWCAEIVKSLKGD